MLRKSFRMQVEDTVRNGRTNGWIRRKGQIHLYDDGSFSARIDLECVLIEEDIFLRRWDAKGRPMWKEDVLHKLAQYGCTIIRHYI